MMDKMKYLLCVILMMSGVFGGGCKQEDSSVDVKPASYPYKIVATTGMVSDIVKQVAGDKANVQGIIGQGVDPHLYNPTRNDVAAIQGANVVFYSGLFLEGKMATIFSKLQKKGKRVFAVCDVINKKMLLTPADFEGHPDPHVWMNVTLWMQAVRGVEQALSKYDMENAKLYQKNAAEYLEKLRALEEYVRTSVETIPEGSRVLITAHDAFNYFGKAYGIEVKGIQGISTESEAGVHDINVLIDYIVKGKIGAVFVESSVSEKNIKALIEGAKSRGHVVKIGGELYSDAMGEPGTYEGTYIGMIDHNVTLIVRALGGKVPAKGMNGKLTLKEE